MDLIHEFKEINDFDSALAVRQKVLTELSGYLKSISLNLANILIYLHGTEALLHYQAKAYDSRLSLHRFLNLEDISILSLDDQQTLNDLLEVYNQKVSELVDQSNPSEATFWTLKIT